MKITLFYDHVTVLDYAYYDEHLGPVGHSQIVDVEFTGKTDDEGVVFDFSYAKKAVKEIIDRECDHRFVVPKGLCQSQGENFYLKGTFGYYDQAYEYVCPKEGICEIPYRHVSDASLVTHLETLVMKEMPETVSSVKLSLRKEVDESEKAFFHYTHGLKDHYGNCQRLIHGHRSTVEVYVNDVKNFELETFLAKSLFSSNIHFAYWENVVNKKEILSLLDATEGVAVGRIEADMNIEIAYTSSQGEFKGVFPASLVYIVPEETTVENLSIHFAQVIKEEFAVGDSVCVRAFEGIGKGSKTSL